MTIQNLINNEVLKPCPFCGKEVTLISSSRSEQFVFNHKGLRNCPFYRFEIPWETAKSISEAAELWNRRINNDT